MFKVSQRLARFGRETEGSATLEFMIWVPLIFAGFLSVIDFAHAFTVNSTMWHQARIAARGLSMHEISEQQARAMIADGLGWSRSSFDIDIEETRSQVDVRVSAPIATTGIINFATGRVRGDWVAKVSVLREPV